MPAFRHLEDQFVPLLAQDVVQLLPQLKKRGSLLLLGGQNPNLAQALSKAANVKSFVYADGDSASLLEADASGLLTSQCVTTQPEVFLSLGKYDGIVMKGIFEENVNIEEFMFALWKGLKLHGNAVILLRETVDRLPLPPSAFEAWEAKTVTAEVIKAEASELSFVIEERKLRYQVVMTQPMIEDLAMEIDNESNEELETDIDEISGGDQITAILLTKVIT